jgi:hypothetical protein
MAEEPLGLGVYIGLNDQHGKPIHIGDTLMFDAHEWGEPMSFVIELRAGMIVHPGATSDLTSWCTVTHCVLDDAQDAFTQKRSAIQAKIRQGGRRTTGEII